LEIRDFIVFSEDLGECSRFPFGLPASSGRLVLSYVFVSGATPSAGTLAFEPNLRVQPLRF